MDDFTDALPPGVVLIEGLPRDPLAGLSEGERARHEGFPAAKRKADWLMGRLAAKEAVARACGARGSLEIVSAPSGAPRVRGISEPLALTITHGHGRAGAWALSPGPGGGLPGLDLERVKSRPEGTFRFYLHPEEREWLAAFPAGSGGEAGPRDRAAVVSWALKEAAFKALQPPRGTGLLDVGLSLCGDPGLAEGRAEVRYLNAAAPRADALGVESVEAGWILRGDLVLAWVIARGARLPEL